MNRAGLFALLFFCFFVSLSSAYAQVVLLVNDSNPSVVVFTATGNNPLNSSPFINNYIDGIDLFGFFLSSPAGTYSSGATSTSLTTGFASAAYYDTASVPLHFGAYDDLLLQGTSNGSALEYFQSSSPAFSGSATFDLSSSTVESLLPNPYSSGTLYAGSSLAERVAIGQWAVISVPEPSAWTSTLGVDQFLLKITKKRARIFLSPCEGVNSFGGRRRKDFPAVGITDTPPAWHTQSLP